MDVNFVKLSPTQNMTLLVTNPLPRERYASCATALMKYESLYAEQTGFVEKPSNPKARARLQMMGGEFCGNATMALAVLVARDDGFTLDVPRSVLLEVSGTDELVPCFVTPKGDHFVGKVRIPLPQSIQDKEIICGGRDIRAQVLHLPGISHMLVTEACSEAGREDLIRHIIQNRLDYTREDALGILFLNEKKMEMIPAVYVHSLESLVWERGCGSGSAATGYALSARQGKEISVGLRQPGGVITVSTVCTGGGEIEELWIEGNVHIVAEGKAYY